MVPIGSRPANHNIHAYPPSVIGPQWAQACQSQYPLLHPVGTTSPIHGYCRPTPGVFCHPSFLFPSLLVTSKSGHSVSFLLSRDSTYPSPLSQPSPFPWASGVLANSRSAPTYPFFFHTTEDICLQWGFSPRMILPPGDTGQHLVTSVVITTGGAPGIK